MFRGSEVGELNRCQAKGCVAQLHPYSSRVKILVGSFFAGMWGQANQEPSGGVVRISESPSGAAVFHPFL